PASRRDAGLAGTAKFISQVGDYSYSLSRRAAAGKKLTDEERKTLAKLSHNAAELSGSLDNLAANGTRGLSGAGTSFSADLSELEAQFPEYPTLIYDGPFSEHLLNRKYAFLEGKPACTIDEARKRAAAFLGVSPAALKTNGKKSGGALPVFTFSHGSASVDVTEIGCSVLSMLDSRTPARATLTTEDAIARAAAFLKKRGYNSLAASYYTKYSGTIMINFAPREGGVMLYPDLVKITIALDTGAVANFEAQGYITNHKKRTLPKPKIGEAAARTRVPSGLKLLSTSLTLIPGDGERETLAYELKCRDADGKHILVYIDAQTGDEIRILVLIEDENGTLVM
ncbi:MAG: germination protein YpeB, partial [Oscillospiraceae bacterium]